MDSVEEASSYKYDWHASSNIQISGNRGEKAEGTRAMAHRPGRKIVLEPTTLQPFRLS
jgi:hypothetical protein